MGGPGTSPFGARGKSSVRYGTRLGDLKNKQSTEPSFIPYRTVTDSEYRTVTRIGFFCFPIKHSTHTLPGLPRAAKMAAYSDPPPVIPLPDTGPGVAQAAYAETLLPGSARPEMFPGIGALPEPAI